MQHDVVQAVALLDGRRMPGWLTITDEWVRLVARSGAWQEQTLTHRSRDVVLVTPLLAVLPLPQAYLRLEDDERAAWVAVARWARGGLLGTLTEHGFQVEQRRNWFSPTTGGRPT